MVLFRPSLRTCLGLFGALCLLAVRRRSRCSSTAGQTTICSRRGVSWASCGRSKSTVRYTRNTGIRSVVLVEIYPIYGYYVCKSIYLLQVFTGTSSCVERCYHIIRTIRYSYTRNRSELRRVQGTRVYILVSTREALVHRLVRSTYEHMM